MQVVNCLIQVFMGAVSGYYTNKLAISHLFTDILLPGGTWKAVIKKGGNKERLAEDLSQLAEDHIIGTSEGGESYLYQELSKPEVLLALDQCIEDVFRELEQGSAGQRKLTEVVEEILQKEQVLQELLKRLAADWKLCDFISEEAFFEFFGEIWEKELFPILSGDQGLETFLDTVFRELADGSREELTISAACGEDFCRKMEEITIGKIMEIMNAMEHDRDRMRMEGYLHSICRKLGIRTILREFLVSVRQKTLGEVLSDSGQAWLSEQLCFLLEQPGIRGSLENLFKILQEELMRADWKLLDILPEGCLESERMQKILKEEMKKLQPFVGSLYEDNQEFISERIAQELTAVIEEGTGNFLQNMVLFSAKDIIIEKMQEFLKEKLPGKIQGFLEEPPEEFCIELSHAIGAVSVSDLIGKLSFDMVFDYVQRECKKGENKKILTVPLSFFLTDDSMDSFSKKAEEAVLLFVSEWLKGEEKKEQAKRAVHFLLGALWEKPLKKRDLKKLRKWIKKRSMPEKIVTWLNRCMAYTVPNWLYGKLSEITVQELLCNQEKILQYAIAGKYKEELTLGSMIALIPREPLKQKIRELFVQNAGNYLSIKPIVKEKILSLDEDMLCTMMQKFMGTQLRPLNRIGGALGAGIGLLLWLFHPSLEISLPMIVLAMFCYALIGIGTNVLALHGLFRPYHPQERKWLARFAGKDGNAANPVMACYRFLSKIPGIRNLFCLGYIPEKKDMIAKQLSSFVADNFLKPNDLLPQIKITEEMAQSFLENHKDAMAGYAVEKLWKADWEGTIRQAVGKLLCSPEREQENILWLKQEMAQKGSLFLAKAVFLALQERKEKPLGDVVNAEQAAKVLTKFLSKQAEQQERNQEWLAGFLQRQYLLLWKEKPARELLLNEQERSIQKTAETVSDFLYHGTWAEPAMEKALSFLLEGRGREIIENNMDSLELFFFQMLKKACQQYLSSHEDALVDKLDREIQTMVDTMASMPLGGMASSMLGIRQLIGKVFHNLFIEPPIRDAYFYGMQAEDKEDIEEEKENTEETWNAENIENTEKIKNAEQVENTEQAEQETEKSRKGLQRYLHHELFDRNEAILRKKIKEIFTLQVLPLKSEEIKEILFAAAPAEERNLAEKIWINSLCAKIAVIKNCYQQSMGEVQSIIGIVLEHAGSYSIGEYENCMDSAFLGEAVRDITGTMTAVIQKPSIKQECSDYLRYVFEIYLLSGDCSSFALITESSLSSMIQNTWKYLACLPCMDILFLECFHRTAMVCQGQETALSILISKCCHALKEKESIREGCREFLSGSLEMVSKEGVVSRQIICELLDNINTACTGLVQVAEEVDFANVIYLAVMDMTDAQIEELFKGFAGQYFLSLKLSGALGFVFGVPVIQWVAAIVAIGSGFAGKKEKDEIK